MKLNESNIGDLVTRDSWEGKNGTVKAIKKDVVILKMSRGGHELLVQNDDQFLIVIPNRDPDRAHA